MNSVCDCGEHVNRKKLAIDFEVLDFAERYVMFQSHCFYRYAEVDRKMKICSKNKAKQSTAIMYRYYLSLSICSLCSFQKHKKSEETKKYFITEYTYLCMFLPTE